MEEERLTAEVAEQLRQSTARLRAVLDDVARSDVAREREAWQRRKNFVVIHRGRSETDN
jgi:hypothetical protein